MEQAAQQIFYQLLRCFLHGIWHALEDTDDDNMPTFQSITKLSICQTYYVLLSCGVIVLYGEDDYRFSLDGLQTIQALHITQMEMHITRTRIHGRGKLICFICIGPPESATPLKQAASSIQSRTTSNHEPIPPDLCHHINHLCQQSAINEEQT